MYDATEVQGSTYNESVKITQHRFGTHVQDSGPLLKYSWSHFYAYLLQTDIVTVAEDYIDWSFKFNIPILNIR